MKNSDIREISSDTAASIFVTALARLLDESEGVVTVFNGEKFCVFKYQDEIIIKNFDDFTFDDIPPDGEKFWYHDNFEFN